jgi:hypothetical protein
LLIVGILRITGDVLELLGQGDALIDGLLVPDDALDVGAKGVLVVGILSRVFLEEPGRVFLGGLGAVVVGQVGIGLLDELPLRVFLDKGLERRRVGLAPEGGRLAQGEFGGLGIGNGRLEILVGVRALLSLGIEGDDLLVELLALRFQCRGVAIAALLSQLKGDLDVGRFLGVALGQDKIGVDAGDGFLNLFQELVGGGAVADDPIDFLPVLVDEELRGRRVDAEFLVDRVADLIAARGPVEDDVFVEEIGVFRVVVELLNQQFAGPSATREKVDEDELVELLGLGQRLVEGAGEDRGRLGGGEGGDEEEAGDGGEFLHAVLLGKGISFRSIYINRRRNATCRSHE